MKIPNLTLSLITSVSLLSSNSYANTVELDPIVVNSDFREKKLSQTSNSVTILSEDKLIDKAVLSLENVIGAIPNVNFTAGASRAHYLQIRGIGERSQFVAPVNPSVALLLDGIDLSSSALALTMFDVNQIEVLKGPQGTTFGANAMAGLISLKSKEPSEESQGHIETSFGNYNTKALGLAVGGSIIENKLLARFSLYEKTSDGFMNNTYLNRKDTQNIDELTSKAQFTWLKSDKHTLDLNLLHVDVNNGYDAFTFDNSLNSTSDEPGKDTQKTNALALKSQYQVNNKMHLLSKTSYSKSDMIYSYDEDWSYTGAFADALGPYSSFDEYIRKREKVDFDFSLISDEEGRIFNNTSDWTLGLYYKQQEEDLIRNQTSNTRYKSVYNSKNHAIYGQLNSHLSEKLSLITGLRVEKWQAEFTDSNNLKIDTKEVLLGAKVGLSYQEDENNLSYILLSKGYKPGGVNANNTLTNNAREYKTEHLWNLDLGKNFSILDNKIKSRVNVFYGLRRNQQVKSSLVQTQNNGSTSFIDYFANAAKSNYYGAELQSDYYVNKDLHIFASLGLLKSTFDEYSDPNPSSVDVNKRAPAQAPKYQYNIGFAYMLSDFIEFKADLEGKASYFFSNRHNQEARSYSLINTSLSYTNEAWTITLWGKNLTNEAYQTRGFNFGNNPSNGYASELHTQQGNPRTFGFTAGYYF